MPSGACEQRQAKTHGPLTKARPEESCISSSACPKTKLKATANPSARSPGYTAEGADLGPNLQEGRSVCNQTPLTLGLAGGYRQIVSIGDPGAS